MTLSYAHLLGSAGLYLMIAGFTVYSWTRPTAERMDFFGDAVGALLVNAAVVILCTGDVLHWWTGGYHLVALVAAVAVVLRVVDTCLVNRYLESRPRGDPIPW